MILFIPIKEKSQRVPNKNFRMFKGKPLWQWTLAMMHEFKIYIDTDSRMIVNACKNFENVHAYKRKKSLCGHDIPVNDLIKNFFKTHGKDIGNEVVTQIHVTSPFLKPETISEAEYYFKLGYDSVVSCDMFKNRFWRKEEYGFCPVNHDPRILRETQTLPEFYMENSAFYMFTKKSFIENKNRIGKNPAFHLVKFPENLDIDTEDDWEFVKKMETFV